MPRSRSQPADLAQRPAADEPLSTWLRWLEALHPVEIDLGLERVGRVADRAGLRPVEQPVIIVGGTNGKGSTVQMLSAIYRAAGYRTGAYTSPHITDFNERMHIDGDMASDTDIVAALAVIEEHRKSDTLTYFEYTTLAAMHLFLHRGCDVMILEVGLGGRLDAANIWDADCAIVTSIAVDHQAWLGDSREAIGREKAAIGRSGRPLIVGDAEPPRSVMELAAEQGMDLLRIDAANLPLTSLAGEHQRRNAACALAAIEALQGRLPVAAGIADAALGNVALAGRFERHDIQGIPVVLDVAHNPAAAASLCKTLQHRYSGARVHLLLAMLADKDIDGVVAALAPVVSHWYCAALDVPRAAPVGQLAAAVRQHVIPDAQVEQNHDCVPGQHAEPQPNTARLQTCTSVADGWQSALADCLRSRQQPADVPVLILVAGSFYTLSALHEYWQAAEPE